MQEVRVQRRRSRTPLQKQGGRQMAASEMVPAINSPCHPSAAAPVAAGLVLAEAVAFMRAPAPIVLVHDHTRVAGEFVGLMCVPAGVPLAYDGRGCAEAGCHDDTGANCGGGKKFSQHCSSVSREPMPGEQN